MVIYKYMRCKKKKDEVKKDIENTKKEYFLNQQKIDTVLKERNSQIMKELKDGIGAIRKYPKSVTIFGSARTKTNDKYYKKAKSLSGKICKEGFAVVTGGGPGIMQACNHGSFEACGNSIGFNIILPFEQDINPYVTHGVNFNYFFTRKISLIFSSEVYICFSGGFGTLDEFFQVLTLIQTKKIPYVPIILVGKDFWQPLVKFIEKVLLEKYKTISKKDLKLYKIVDDEKEIIKIIKKAKIRNEFSELKSELKLIKKMNNEK